MKFKLLAFTLLVSFSTDLVAKPALVVLEYRDRNTSAEGTEKFTDRLREEFRRRLDRSVLDRQETADLFFYHQKAALHPTASHAAKLLEEGKKAYFELHLPEAMEIFDKIIRLPREESGEVLIEARLLQGLTAMALGDLQKAREVFGEALRLDHTVQLDSSFFPPKTVKFFHQIREEMDLPMGTVKVGASPVGAEVSVNGILKGLAPVDLKLPAGRHVISVSASHYRLWREIVEIQEGSIHPLQVRLDWQKGDGGKALGLSEEDVGLIEKLPEIGRRLGEQMGVEKVLFVSHQKKEGTERISTHLVDVDLGTEHRVGVFPVDRLEERSAEIAGEVADHVMGQMGAALAHKPDRFAENRYQGDIVLIGHHRKPFYKKPLFWVVVGAAGAGGGIAAAVAGGGAATGTLGVIFQ